MVFVLGVGLLALLLVVEDRVLATRCVLTICIVRVPMRGILPRASDDGVSMIDNAFVRAPVTGLPPSRASPAETRPLRRAAPPSRPWPLGYSLNLPEVPRGGLRAGYGALPLGQCPQRRGGAEGLGRERERERER